MLAVILQLFLYSEMQNDKIKLHTIVSNAGKYIIVHFMIVQ